MALCRMKTMVGAICLLAASLSAVGCSSTKKTPADTATASTTRVHAKIVKADPAAKIVTVALWTPDGDLDKPTDIACGPNVEIYLDGKPAELADLQGEPDSMITLADGLAVTIQAKGGRPAGQDKAGLSFKNQHARIVRIDAKSGKVTLDVIEADGQTGPEVLVSTTDKTEILVNAKAAKIQDMHSGQEVFLTASGGVAGRIMVISSRKAEPPRTAKTRIVRIDPNERRISLAPSDGDASGGEQIVVAVDEKTDILVGGKPVAFADLSVGQDVVVTFVAGTAVKIRGAAATVARKDEAATRICATIAKIDAAAGTLELSPCSGESGGAPIVVTTDAKTEILIAGKAAEFADLAAGQAVAVTFKAGTASRILAGPKKTVAPRTAYATVVRTDANSSTVTVTLLGGEQEERIALAVNESTAICLAGKAGGFGDLQAGQYVAVAFTDGTASSIEVRRPAPGPASKPAAAAAMPSDTPSKPQAFKHDVSRATTKLTSR